LRRYRNQLAELKDELEDLEEDAKNRHTTEKNISEQIKNLLIEWDRTRQNPRFRF
jgi:hypothetical protein